MDGLELLREIRRRRPDAVVVLMTAYATVRGAVEAMRDGRLRLPGEALRPRRGGPAPRARPRGARAAAREPRAAPRGRGARRCSSRRTRRCGACSQTARQAAASDATILLTGESGTGKNVLAAAIHGWSPRAAGPFVMIVCTTLSEHLLESELFGHVKGAFTGAWKDKPGRLEAARGGTVFLDEVGELPPELQGEAAALPRGAALRARRRRRPRARSTCASSPRPTATSTAEVRAGRFRQDLFYRLNVIGIALPPLRERPEDLPALIDHLLATLCARHRRPPLALDARGAGGAARLPVAGQRARAGERARARARALARRRRSVPRTCPTTSSRPAPTAPGDARRRRPRSPSRTLERRHVRAVLAESATLEEAAARLGINPTTLWRKRKRWGLD